MDGLRQSRAKTLISVAKPGVPGPGFKRPGVETASKGEKLEEAVPVLKKLGEGKPETEEPNAERKLGETLLRAKRLSIRELEVLALEIKGLGEKVSEARGSRKRAQGQESKERKCRKREDLHPSHCQNIGLPITEFSL